MVNNGKILCWLRKTWLSLRILGLIAGLLIMAVVAYAKLNGQVSNNTVVAEKALKKADENEKTIIRMEEAIKYIKAGVDDVKRELKK